VISLVVVALCLWTSAANAAFEFDLVITGPGMRHPVTLRWDQMSKALVKQRASGFFNSAPTPRGSLGPAYDLEVRGYLPSTPPRSLGVQHWTYYPHRYLVQFHDATDARHPWAVPAASLRSLLDGAIASAHGRNIPALGVAAGVIVGTTSLLLLHLRRRKKPLLRTGTSPPSPFR
jgi:hypothetical protein